MAKQREKWYKWPSDYEPVTQLHKEKNIPCWIYILYQSYTNLDFFINFTKMYFLKNISNTLFQKWEVQNNWAEKIKLYKPWRICGAGEKLRLRQERKNEQSEAHANKKWNKKWV